MKTRTAEAETIACSGTWKKNRGSTAKTHRAAADDDSAGFGS